MNAQTSKNPPGETVIGAYEAKTKFSELIARAERGESFTVTKNGRPVARISPAPAFDRQKARAAADRILALLDAQGPPVSEQQAQRNWEELRADMERDFDERTERWSKS